MLRGLVITALGGFHCGEQMTLGLQFRIGHQISVVADDVISELGI